MYVISDELDYGFNQTRTELFALDFEKIAESDCLHSSINKCRPLSTNMVTIYMTLTSWMSSIMGQIPQLNLE